MDYSPLTCAAGLLCGVPPVPSPGQGDHLLLPPGQQSCHATNMRMMRLTKFNSQLVYKYAYNYCHVCQHVSTIFAAAFAYITDMSHLHRISAV